MEPFAKIVNYFKMHDMVLELSVTLHFVRKSTLFHISRLHSLFDTVEGFFFAKPFLKQFAKHRNTKLLLAIP